VFFKTVKPLKPPGWDYREMPSRVLRYYRSMLEVLCTPFEMLLHERVVASTFLVERTTGADELFVDQCFGRLWTRESVDASGAYGGCVNGHDQAASRHQRNSALGKRGEEM
jgi:hypothetical protein